MCRSIVEVSGTVRTAFLCLKSFFPGELRRTVLGLDESSNHRRLLGVARCFYGDLRSRGESELLEDVSDMSLHRSLADE